MPKRALIEHRPWLFASVALSIAYYLVVDKPLGQFFIMPGTFELLIKGAGVGLLSVYAFRRAPGLDGKLIGLVLALSALADMALELAFDVGGALFAASHLVAIILYLRNRRERTTISQWLFAIALFVATPLVSWLLSESLEVALYAAILGTMAAVAWTSRFPRYRVGIGAVLFVVSDWLIFSGMGSFDLGVLPALLVWPLYYSGQLMIATGVVQTLRGERSAR